MASRTADSALRAPAFEAETAGLVADSTRPTLNPLNEGSAAANAGGGRRLEGAIPNMTMMRAGMGAVTMSADDRDTDRFWQHRNERPPYDFSWSWHNAAGSPPSTLEIDRSAGWISLAAGSGSIEGGGANTFIEAHAGFGLILEGCFDFHGFNLGQEGSRWFSSFEVSASIGGSATSRGGTEGTVLKDGQSYMGNARTLWDRRVSANPTHPVDSASGDSGSFIPDEPMGFAWPSRTGHQYTFNVGVWVFTDTDPSLAGSAGSACAISGYVPRIRVETSLMPTP
ncbi:hypothetical protein QA942_23295 [Streptomyces sp. B21-106]|uniref:hypothetical protein n=1 Tax=Streptomyces sp. B21-106 TaxID=3039418 RepID=UPI002FF21C7E